MDYWVVVFGGCFVFDYGEEWLEGINSVLVLATVMVVVIGQRRWWLLLLVVVLVLLVAGVVMSSVAFSGIPICVVCACVEYVFCGVIAVVVRLSSVMLLLLLLLFVAISADMRRSVEIPRKKSGRSAGLAAIVAVGRVEG